MINLPRRGQARRLGLTFRWAIGCPTISDYDAMRSGGLFEKLRVLRRIRRAGLVSRMLCAREIHNDIQAQLKACAFPAAPGADKGDGSVDPTIRRFALEVTRCTGMSPRDQYDKLTPLEWSRLLAHCAWVQGREDRYFASMTSKAVIGGYPDMRDSSQAREVDQTRIRDLMTAWTGGTRH